MSSASVRFKPLFASIWLPIMWNKSFPTFAVFPNIEVTFPAPLSPAPLALIAQPGNLPNNGI